jgi:DDE family transposase
VLHGPSGPIEHSVLELVGQRVYGLALGYEDLNDHDELRRDPLLATLVGKVDPTGAHRLRERDAGKALAGKSTLNRLELTTADASSASRYKKIVIDGTAVDRLFVNVFLHAFREVPRQIVLDLDATDDPLHGNQEGRFFHGFYGNYCYLPLYIFCGEFLLCARLRRSNIDASSGTVDELQRIVTQIRAAWPRVQIIIRADSGFAREEIMAWCEAQAVDYVLGLAKNTRLKRALSKELREAKREHAQTGAPARVFKDFTYKTRKSWSRRRRVVGKAEYLSGGPNPRFVVTSILKEDTDARALYEDVYCARGDMENRIKEQQLGLFADRTSTATMRANQIRLWLSSVAYVLLHALRRLGLQGTTLARAQCHTIRLKLLKIGAQVRVTVRKIWVSLASGSPYATTFEQTYLNLLAVPLHG